MDLANLGPGDVAAPAEQGKQPLGIGLALPADADGEPNPFPPAPSAWRGPASRRGGPGRRPEPSRGAPRRQGGVPARDAGARSPPRAARGTRGAGGPRTAPPPRPRPPASPRRRQPLLVPGPDLLGGGNRQPLGLRARHLEHPLHLEALGGGGEEHRAPLLPGAAGAPAAVLQRLRVAGDVGVDHQLDAGKVESAGGDVGGHQDAGPAVAQQLQRPCPFTLGAGTTFKEITKSKLRPFSLPYAPLNEQRRIVAKIEELLTRLDAGVASLKRAQANLKRYKASVLKAACEGRLVPTEAELARAEGRSYEPASELLQRILVEREGRGDARRRPLPQPPDTRGLPELPEGWCCTFLKPLLSFERTGLKTGPFGSLLRKHEHRDQGIPVLGIEKVEPMRFVAGSKIHITSEKAARLIRIRRRAC